MNKLIKFQDLTPEVYYKRSRDFQYIGRLFDLVLNNAKMNTDIISSLPLNPDMDPRLLDLLALTLGFKSKHEYNTKQLAALCSIFPFVLRNKGSKLAIETACNALLNAEGITKEASIEVGNQTVSIFLPSELSDLNLLKDLLNYILPAGMSCSLIQEATLVPPKSTTLVNYQDYVVNYTNTSKKCAYTIKGDCSAGIFVFAIGVCPYRKTGRRGSHYWLFCKSKSHLSELSY